MNRETVFPVCIFAIGKICIATNFCLHE